MGEEYRALRPYLCIRPSLSDCSLVLLQRQGAFGRVRMLFAVLFAAFLLVATAIAAEHRYDIPIGNSPQKGPTDAPVTIIEFLDFQ